MLFYLVLQKNGYGLAGGSFPLGENIYIIKLYDSKQRKLMKFRLDIDDNNPIIA